MPHLNRCKQSLGCLLDTVVSFCRVFFSLPYADAPYAILCYIGYIKWILWFDKLTTNGLEKHRLP